MSKWQKPSLNSITRCEETNTKTGITNNGYSEFGIHFNYPVHRLIKTVSRDGFAEGPLCFMENRPTYLDVSYLLKE